MCSAKGFHIFSTKNDSALVTFTFKVFTNDVVNFEQPGPSDKQFATEAEKTDSGQKQFQTFKGFQTGFFSLQGSRIVIFHLSRIMRKPDFCICKNIGAD